ncbi:MAG TPA: proton-conducting transporter membrane subunit [Synergistaceae bacterium]|nr:proton-conducting transporter membrane subunit [Synergistaceae bacterium]
MSMSHGDLWFQWMWIFLATAPLGALLLGQWPRASTLWASAFGALGSLAGIGASLIVLGGSGGGLRWTIDTALPFLTADICLDALAAFFLLLLSVVNLAVSIYIQGYAAHYAGRRPLGVLHFLTGTFVMAMAGVFVAHSYTLFFLLWEAMSLLSFFLVVFEPEERGTPQAGMFYLVMTHLGSAFLLVGLLGLMALSGGQGMTPLATPLTGPLRWGFFALFLVGFATKGGVAPLHVWLPYAHPAAPSSVSALMSGVMIKTAVYGMVRFFFDLLGPVGLGEGAVLMGLGGLSALTGVAYAYTDRNIKRMLAYSSIENMGIITLFLGTGAVAIATGHPGAGALGLGAALLHTLNHALFKGMLFLGAGSVHQATHTKHMDDLGGLMKTMPRTGALMLLGGLALASIVPMNGFIGEWLGLQSLAILVMRGGAALGIPALLGAATVCLAGALAAVAVVKFLGVAFLGVPRTRPAAEAQEVPPSMWGAQAFLGGMCLLGGLFPGPFLALVRRGLAPALTTPWPSPLAGGVAFLWAPMRGELSSAWPLGAIFLGAAAVVVLTWGLWKTIRHPEIRRYGTWDCGYGTLSPRMQYSARGFANPLVIVFRALFRPTRELSVVPGPSPYHPRGVRYTTRTERLFESRLYLPVMDRASRLSRLARGFIQTGSIHLYLVYIFVTLLALLLYARIA